MEVIVFICIVLLLLEMIVRKACKAGCASIGKRELLLLCQLVKVSWPRCRGAIDCARSIAFDESNPYAQNLHISFDRTLVSEWLNTTSGKVQRQYLHSALGTLQSEPCTRHSIALSQPVKSRHTLYTSWLEMVSFRDTFETCGLIMSPQKAQ
jgi:hypothetical protein